MGNQHRPKVMFEFNEADIVGVVFGIISAAAVVSLAYCYFSILQKDENQFWVSELFPCNIWHTGGACYGWKYFFLLTNRSMYYFLFNLYIYLNLIFILFIYTFIASYNSSSNQNEPTALVFDIYHHWLSPVGWARRRYLYSICWYVSRLSSCHSSSVTRLLFF